MSMVYFNSMTMVVRLRFGLKTATGKHEEWRLLDLNFVSFGASKMALNQQGFV